MSDWLVSCQFGHFKPLSKLTRPTTNSANANYTYNLTNLAYSVTNSAHINMSNTLYGMLANSSIQGTLNYKLLPEINFKGTRSTFWNQHIIEYNEFNTTRRVFCTQIVPLLFKHLFTIGRQYIMTFSLSDKGSLLPVFFQEERHFLASPADLLLLH